MLAFGRRRPTVVRWTEIVTRALWLCRLLYATFLRLPVTSSRRVSSRRVASLSARVLCSRRDPVTSFNSTSMYSLPRCCLLCISFFYCILLCRPDICWICRFSVDINNLHSADWFPNYNKLCAWRHNMPPPPTSWQYLRMYSPGGTCSGVLAI